MQRPQDGVRMPLMPHLETQEGFFHLLSALSFCCSIEDIHTIFHLILLHYRTFPNSKNIADHYGGFFQPYHCATVYEVE